MNRHTLNGTFPCRRADRRNGYGLCGIRSPALPAIALLGLLGLLGMLAGEHWAIFAMRHFGDRMNEAPTVQAPVHSPMT
jgi:XapX domain-containing protein